MIAASRKLNVIFLCTGNSCRSQMAEGWARALLSDVCVAYSAGVEEHGMNPMAVRVMQEAGVDITDQFSKNIDGLPKIDIDIVVTVCDHARESCPVLPGAKLTLHRNFEDPPRLAAGLDDEQAVRIYRRVRDDIRDYVEGLPAYFETVRLER
ncbi:MAG TPA: arsenate reductase [Bacteroidetes bacterium]|nr:arsenate reductase [Bacteroidota bacterium]HRK04279.1 arsenate reductase ArsC [Chlorobiota bacterium]